MKKNHISSWLLPLFLSLMDFTLIQVFLNEVPLLVIPMDRVVLTWLFPSPASPMLFVLWLGLLFLRLKAPDKESLPPQFYDWLMSGLFACLFLVGYSFHKANSFSLISANSACLKLSLFSLLALCLLIHNILRWSRHFFHQLTSSSWALPRLWQRHPWFFPFVVIMLCWIPWAVAKYPGGIDFDSYLQMLEPLGHFELSNHWPVSSSFFFAGCYLLGRFISGSSNFGLFFTIFCQMLFCAACLAYSLKAMYKLKVRPSMMALTLLVYALATIFTRYCTSIGKDCLFSCALLLCLSMMAELLYGSTVPSLRNFILLLIVSLLMSVLRSNGPYILIFLIFALGLGCLIRPSATVRKLLISFVGAWCLCSCYLNVLLPAFDIPGAPSREAFSVPFMQTARYVKYFGDEVTEEERSIIDAVLDYDALPELYNETISDAVKASYHGKTSDLLPYFKVWLRQGLRHPEVYLSATINNIYPYFYPGQRENSMGIYMQFDPVNDAPLQLFSLPEEEFAARSDRLDMLTEFILAFENFPLFYPISNVALHTWLLLYLSVAALFRRRGNLLILLVPSLVGLLICFAGPTFFHNGLRYALPVIFSNPFLLSLFCGREVPSPIEDV